MFVSVAFVSPVSELVLINLSGWMFVMATSAGLCPRDDEEVCPIQRDTDVDGERWWQVYELYVFCFFLCVILCSPHLTQFSEWVDRTFKLTLEYTAFEKAYRLLCHTWHNGLFSHCCNRTGNTGNRLGPRVGRVLRDGWHWTIYCIIYPGTLACLRTPLAIYVYIYTYSYI